MKQTSIQFSALLIIFLFSGIGSALAQPSGSFLPANVTAGNMSVIINYNGTGRPGDTVNITADFNTSVANATISITDNPLVGASNANLVGASGDTLVDDALMTPLGDNAFSYNYQIPEDLSGLLGVDVSPLDSEGNLISPSDSEGNPLDDGFDGFSDNGFGVDPYIDIISPDSEFANKKCVDFNFTGYDYYQDGSQITYAFLLDGVQKNNGVITVGEYKKLQFELAEGKHTWEVKTKDSQGTHTTGTRALYVDTQCPSIKLTSPQDCFKEVIGATQFNFTCEDVLASQYKDDITLSYQMYIDGELAENFSNSGDEFSGDIVSGESIVKELELPDGAHNWSVSVQDGAGNNVTSEVRKFYVDIKGLTVNTVNPNGGYISANPTFNFTVTGNNSENNWDGSGFPFENGDESSISGAGLPFDYKLLIDGKEVKASCDCDDCNSCDGDEGDNEGDNGCVSCSGGDCDGSCFVVGKDIYSIKAAVADGFNKNWTVIITDRTTGKTYQPSLKYFSVDSVAPAPVANLKVVDTPGETYWTELSNSPGLYVSWNASNEKDLASKPYDVLISTSKPSCIEDMEKVQSTSSNSLTIVNCTGEPLVYGKDYWVAVVARDNASNYDKCFSMCGPVQTYEDMNITLNEGWNLKSVPKRLAASYDCPESVFGEGNTVLYWDGSCWQFPDTIEPCKGYWIYAKEPCTTNIKLKGMSSDCGNPDAPASLTLSPGWHMIGHTSGYAAPWNMTLSSLSDSGDVFNGLLTVNSYKFSNLITYSGSEGWGGIIPEMTDSMSTGGLTYMNGADSLPVGALQSDNYMVPGQGYWIFMKNEGTYASIENVYNPDILQDMYGGTDDGTDNGTGDIGDIGNIPIP